jgi:hypothetical protein
VLVHSIFVDAVLEFVAITREFAECQRFVANVDQFLHLLG